MESIFTFISSISQQRVGMSVREFGKIQPPSKQFPLPSELFQEVLARLPQEDILSLSSTCKTHRKLAAPLAFRVLRFSSSVAYRSGLSSALLAAERYANLVEELEFTVAESVDPELATPKREEVSEMGAATLPKAATELVSNLQRFPNLKKLSIIFAILRYMDEDAEYYRLDTFAQLTGDCDIDTMRERERTLPWRGIVAETWRALARNEGSLPHLVIKNQPPVLFSALYEAPVVRFLGRLEALTLYARRVEFNHIPQGRRRQTSYSLMGIKQRPEYASLVERELLNHLELRAWMKEMQEHFVKNLRQLRRLRIVCDPKLPFGLYHSKYMPPLPLMVWALPRLERLELEQTIIGKDLVQFLTTAPLDEEQAPCPPRPLKQLILRNCYCHVRESMDNYPWHEFFNDLDCAELQSLEEVDIQIPERICTKAGGLFNDPQLSHNVSAVWESEHRLPYCSCEVISNTLDTESLSEDLQQCDQQALNKLQDMLERRRGDRARLVAPQV